MGNRHVTSGTVLLDSTSDGDGALLDNGGGTIIVDDNAFVMSVDPILDNGMDLRTGAYNVAINGSVFSSNGKGILLGESGALHSKVTIGVTGSVFGDQAIEGLHPFDVVNRGRIGGP